MFKFFVLSLSLIAALTAEASNKLTVYSSYDSARLAPIFAPFTQKTGITVDVVTETPVDLLKRMQSEGANSPADLYLEKDLVYLGDAASSGLLQPFSSTEIAKKIPAHLIENGRNWFFLFYRARVIMYNTQKVTPDQLSTYESLGDSKWQGQLCVRTSNNSYNEALAAFLVKHLGAERTEKVLAAWVQNFAVEPIKGDTDLIKAIAAGTCSVGIANTYYLAPLVRDDASFPVRPFFPNQKDIGAHINGVGIGITKSSKNLPAANALLEYMISDEVQEAIAGGFSQYPASKTAKIAPILTTFGPFKEDTTSPDAISALVPKAKEIIQKVGYK